MDIYTERAHLIAYLASQHPAALSYSDPDAPEWAVVTIDTPTGQMCWHLHEKDLYLFDHVPVLFPHQAEVQWDGHTTEQKYTRLRMLTYKSGGRRG